MKNNKFLGIDPAGLRLYRVMEKSSKAGEVCPTTRDLVVAGIGGDNARVNRLFGDLIKRGLITVRCVGGHQRRIVTIVETGLTTSDKVGWGARKNGDNRNCLKCHRDFMSTWMGNRICPVCRDSSEWRSGDDGGDYRMVG